MGAELRNSAHIPCMNAPMIDWRDLRIFLTLAEVGSLSAAARALRVDHATVGRRVAALERALGLRLIDRLPRSAPLTPHGVAVAAALAPMAASAVAVERLARLAKAAPAATVRVSAPPAAAAYVIAPRLAAFRRAQPTIAIALSAASGAAALDRGEADIAVRMGRPAQPGLIARRVGCARFALYASPQVARTARDAWSFIGFDATLDHVTSQRWLRTLAGDRPLAFRASDLFSQAEAARAGLGAVVLPRFMGDGDPALVELRVDPPPPTQDYWLVSYPDLASASATRATMAFLAETIGRACPLAAPAARPS